MKKVIIGVGLLALLVFGLSKLGNEAMDPTVSGTIVGKEVVKDTTPKPMVTVPTEEESKVMDKPMEPIVASAPVVMEFVPLAYDGNDRKFAKTYKGKKVKIPASLGKKYGAKKGVRVGKDVYFEGKHALYVFHGGKLIIIKSI